MQLPKIRETVRKYRAILYFQDEANVSLTAFLGKTWAPRGKTPKAQVTGRRGGVAALSAISKRGHLLFALYEKRIASDEVIHFLAQMLRHHRRRHLVVLMDNAPPHVSKKTMTFIDSQPRLHVFNFPSYSPDWNPDEKVWNHLKHQELKSHKAKTKAELKQLTERKLNGMANNPHLVRGLFFRCCVADLFGYSAFPALSSSSRARRPRTPAGCNSPNESAGRISGSRTARKLPARRADTPGRAC